MGDDLERVPPEASTDRARGNEVRRAGRRAMREARNRFAARVIEHLQQREPELLAKFSEPGPDGAPPRIEVVQRLLEQSVERHPSVLATLGLSAIQALTAATDEDAPGSASTLAVAFTDLEGFTEFTAREGDEAASHLLAAHHRAVAPIIRGRGGTLVKRLGDGLLLTFPQPEASVLACLELIDSQPAPLRLRAGVHQGPVVVTHDDVIGHVVNVAARVAEAAAGGQVLVTGQVFDTAASGLTNVRFSPPRDEQFKGLDAPVPLCAATWATKEPTR